MRRRAEIAAAVVLGLPTLAITLYVLPIVLTRHPRPADPVAVLAAQNDVRTVCIGSLVALGTAVTASIAWRAHGLNRSTNFVSRYGSGIEQLADESLTVRLGGVHALRRLGLDDPVSRESIVQVLAAVLRERVAEEREPAGLLPLSPTEQAWERQPRPPADVVAALSALSALRRSETHERLDLRNVALAGIELPSAQLARARLHGADLRRSRLPDAQLSDSTFIGADLRAAYLRSALLIGSRLDFAQLGGALLSDSDLAGARLRSANLSSAVLTNARLTGTDLYHATLRGARLDGADLTGARLDGADLTGAYLVGARLSDALVEGARFVGAMLTRDQLSSRQVEMLAGRDDISWVRQTLSPSP